MADTDTPRPGGTTDLAGRSVARIGYGAMQLGGPGGRPAPPRDEAVAVLRRAVELGVDHIDTAQFYGVGVANELIAAALHPYPADLVIVTKVGAADEGGGLHPAQRPEEVRAQIEDNLRTLRVDTLDAVNMRRMDAGPGHIAEGDQIVDLDDQLATLSALRDEGKVRTIGLSNISLEQLTASLPTGITCVQNAYSLADRHDEPVLELCRQEGIAWVPYFPLGSAFPGLTKVAELPAVVEVAARRGATPAQVGLAWLLAHAPNVALIPGTASVAHLEDNVATAAVTLDADDLAALEATPPE